MRSLFGPPPRRRTTEATPEQIAWSGAAASSWGLDPIDGESGWTPLGSQAREIPAYTVEKARTNSVAAYRINPLARAIIDTYVAFCVGDTGVRYQCTNPDVKEVVDEFWNDPANDMTCQQEILLRDMLIMGESAVEMMTAEVSGVVRYSPVMVSEISAVRLIKNNPMWVDELIFEAAGTLRRPPMRAVRVNDETGLREGEVIYWRPFRTLTSDVRSAPFLMPVLDWIDNYDTVLSNLIDRTSLARYLVWDVTVEGNQQDVENFVQSRGGTAIPRSGSVEVHNQSVKWEPKTVATGAQEDNAANQSVLTLVAGGTGLAKTWLAEPEGANRATASSMAEPVRRRVQSVQKAYLGLIKEMLAYVVDQAVAAKRLPAKVTATDEKTGQEYDIPASQCITVMGPEVAAADSQLSAQVLLNLSTGLQNLVGAGVLSDEAAKVAAKKAWEDYVGVPYTADLDPSPEEQQAKNDQAMAQQLAQLAGLGQNGQQPAKPPPPGANGQALVGVNTGKGKNTPEGT